MAIFMEIRCEMRGEGHGNFSEHCFSDDNADPFLLSPDNHRDVIKTLVSLNSLAKEKGWKKINGAWICPFCQTILSENKNHE